MTSVENPASIVHKIFKPFFSKFLHWYRENQPAADDLIVLFVLSIITYFFIVRSNLLDSFYCIYKPHEDWNL